MNFVDAILDNLRTYWPAHLLLLLYTVVLAHHAWSGNRATKGLADYYIGGRRLGGVALGLSFFATYSSTNSFIGFSGQSYDWGIGTHAQVPGSINAIYAITLSAVMYCFRVIVPFAVPSNHGTLRPLRVVAPEGTVVNALPPSAVAGGNVETSQRIVDVVLGALAHAIPDIIPAASYGTMTNLTIGGIDPRTNEPFAYYETTAGGMGARPTADGLHATHCHMTNSLNTPIEALEHAYPYYVRRYQIRRGSGGAGKHRGGDGIVREIELRGDAEITILSDRRVFPPYGLQGGEPGACGRNSLATPAADGGRSEEQVPGKVSVAVEAGTSVCIETPGGGGWGTPD